MLIEFDPAKNERNIAERGLPFGRAEDFDFDTAIVEVDDRKVYAEPRYVAAGFLDARLHMLCFTTIDGGIRVISFRKANNREIKAYEQSRTAD
ncbi:MAG TPA: BrnT family toxin [Variovorax sp.]